MIEPQFDSSFRVASQLLFHEPSFWVYGLLAFVVLSTIRIVQIAKTTLYGPLSQIPGPALNKWTRTPLAWSRVRRRQVHYVHSLHERYGPIVLVSPDFISFTSPETVKVIHKRNLGLFDRYQGAFPRRKQFSKAFSQAHLLDRENVVRKHVKNAVDSIKVAAGDGEQLDILHLMSQIASGIIAELVLGRSEADTLDGIQHELNVPSSELARSLPWYLKLIDPVVLNWFNQRIAIRSYSLTREHLQQKKGTADRDTLLTELCDRDDQLPDAVLVREAKAFIVAGTDTTAITATYLVWQVLKHPEVRKRLVKELCVLQNDFSLSDIQKLPYLRCVMNETLRLNGSVSSSLPRITPQGGENIGGYLIPEGTLVSTQVFTTHRDPLIFEDPWTFRPERWENPTSEMKGTFMPFGIGSRGCIGLHLAQMELALIAAIFFREFPDAKVGISTRDEDMVAEDMFILNPRGHKCMIVI